MKKVQTLLQAILSGMSGLLALCVGLFLALLLTTIAGESPLLVLQTITKGAFGSAYDFSMTLFYTGPLIFTGLSVALAFQSGLFNIGAEGQLQIGAFAMTLFALSFAELPPFLGITLSFLFGTFCAGMWGAAAGAIRAYRQGHEVIVTIMMNFIASALVAYLTLGFFRTTENQNTETAVISSAYHLKNWGISQGAPLSSAIIWAVITAVLCHYFLYSTRWGYQLRALGENPEASQHMGFPIQRLQVASLFLAGALAAGVGVVEVFGNAHRFRLGFSADLGFIGIPVALLARGRPLAVPVAAFLFASLHTGTSHLDLETEKLTREVSQIFQALVILAVSAEGVFYFRRKKKQKVSGEGVA